MNPALSKPDDFVSIILAVRNEERDIAMTLEALARQEFENSGYEIIVADGCSLDRTLAILSAFKDDQQQLGLDVIVLSNAKQSAASGLNLALSHSRGDIIVRMDGHTQAKADYLGQVVTTLRREGADCVGGPQVAESERPWGRAYGLATQGFLGHGGAQYRSSSDACIEVDTVYLGAWPRGTFERFGDFDESLVRNQDDEHNMRIMDGGGRIVLNPSIRSSYRPRESATGICRQYFGYGLWKPRVIAKHPKRMRTRHVFPSILVLSLIGSFISTFFLIPVLFYLVQLAFFGFDVWKKTRLVGDAVLVMATLVMMHLSYGLGFLLGIPMIFMPRQGPLSSFPTQIGGECGRE